MFTVDPRPCCSSQYAPWCMHLQSGVYTPLALATTAASPGLLLLDTEASLGSPTVLVDSIALMAKDHPAVIQLSEPMGHCTPNSNPGATTCSNIQCPEPLELGPQFLFLQNSVSIFFFSIGAQRAKISGITNHRGISLLIDAKP